MHCASKMSGKFWKLIKISLLDFLKLETYFFWTDPRISDLDLIDMLPVYWQGKPPIRVKDQPTSEKQL